MSSLQGSRTPVVPQELQKKCPLVPLPGSCWDCFHLYLNKKVPRGGKCFSVVLSSLCRAGRQVGSGCLCRKKSEPSHAQGTSNRITSSHVSSTYWHVLDSSLSACGMFYILISILLFYGTSLLGANPLGDRGEAAAALGLSGTR